MIRINLARKRAERKILSTEMPPWLQKIFKGVGGKAGAGGGGFDWKKSPLPRVLVSVLLVYGAQFGADNQKASDIAAIQADIDETQKILDATNRKLAKVKGFEPLKKQLEEDELSLQQKLTVITALNENRDINSKLMKQISEIIPEDVWLSSLTVKDLQINLQGGASSYNMVSDFMNALGISSMLSEVSLAQITESQKDGVKYQQFDISAKRKEIK